MTLAHRTTGIASARDRFVPRGVSTVHPIVIERAEGARVWDADGREYLDFVGGIGVQNVGHRHPRVLEAIERQLGRFTHTCFAVAPYDVYVELCGRLCALVGGPSCKAALFTTGAEAVENAVKIARAHTRRPAVIAFSGAFHGRTLLAVTLTASSTSYRQNFGPFASGVYHAPYPDTYRGWTTDRALAALDELLATEVMADQVAAVILEPQLGEGGFVPAPVDFLRRLRALTERHGIVLILDEIQSGFGRTGRMFGYQHADIEPDLVAVAKSLAAGLPLSAVVGRSEMMDAPLPGGLGGTYAGNPLACAAALAVLDIFDDEGLVANAVRIGTQLRSGLLALQSRVPAIGDVRGLGAMLAIECVKSRETKQPDSDLALRVLDQAREGGLLLLRSGAHKNVIRFLPPLILNDRRTIAQALQIH